MNHCQICGCEMGTPNVIKCTNQTLTQGLLWNYKACDICAGAINNLIEEHKETAHYHRELRDFFIK